MSTLKRCCGYKGYWECAEEYPDHMVPVELFNAHGSTRDGLQTFCKKCNKATMDAWHYSKRKKHPVTGQWKMDWKKKCAESLGGRRGTPEWKEYLNRAEEIWVEDSKNTGVVVQLREEKEKLPRIYKEINKKPPRESIRYPKEGYVYIFKSDDMDSIKVGKTDDVGKRLSAAQTWGRYKCLYYKMSEDCKLLEKNVHDVLFHRRVVEEGLGNEHFRVNLEYAKKVIDHEAARIQSEDDREGPRLGQVSG